ncbi:MAG TPA: septum site-determining protein Ssd [Mycobacteriales bacterium]|nr:septum site-determining protein Ssd [Mycobacteriales bacterium]
MAAGVLVVTADPGLALAIPRLCALAGVPAEIERDSESARAAWRYAAAVLVGFDVAPALAAAGLPRRDRVVVLTAGPPSRASWEAAVAMGASSVLQLPDQEAAVVDELRRGSTVARTAGVIAVIGGSGGAGASTLAAALAITASSRGRTLLVDGDPLGGGLDVLLGAESAPGIRWNELAATEGGLDPHALAAAVCDVHGIGLLSWGRGWCGRIEIAAVESVLAAAVLGFATVVIDVARAPNALSGCLLEASDAAAVLVPADVRSVAATAALVAAFGRRLGVPGLVVRDAGGDRLAANEVAASLAMPLITTLRSEPSVVSASHRGEPPVRRGRGALVQVCDAILETVTPGDMA